MNILFISSGDQPDYQCDTVYHGLKSIYGKTVTSTADMWFMYSDLEHDEQKYLYGLGFTLYGLLSPDIKNVVPVSKVEQGIVDKVYDYIVYGAVQRNRFLLDLVVKHYNSSQIIFIDGEDYTRVDDRLIKCGIYFKRELTVNNKYIHPISFGIPKEKIVDKIPHKETKWSYNYPGKLDTYIFKNENDYYNDYRKSEYAVTFKKAGWDCLRHYEIIANGTIPYFPDIKNCPELTLHDYPKELQLYINSKIDSDNPFVEAEYDEIIHKLIKFVKSSTTESVVKKMLKKANEIAYLYSKKHSYKNEIQFKTTAEFLNDKLKDTTQNMLYFGVASGGTLLSLSYEGKIEIHEEFQCLENSLKKSEILSTLDDPNLHCFRNIILEHKLNYLPSLGSFLIDIKSKMSKDTELYIIVNNFRNIYQYLSILKNNLEFDKLKLAKTLPFNHFSVQRISKLITGYGLIVKDVAYYGVGNNNSGLKTKINNYQSFVTYTAPKIMVTCKLK